MKFLCGKSVAGGVVDGKLADCPATPNCLCSQADREDRRVAPFNCRGPAEAEFARLANLVESLPSTKILSRTESYLHAEFTTRLMRFIDDVGFLLDASAGVIHVRSASRIGYSDLGANRKRLESLRREFERGS